ncbi:MAG: hypothetical protein IKZ47_03340 [Clostridia bacterium]|nr:hypothetical protein [Clostridia bacterium]
MNFRWRLIRFMSGRYGADTLFFVMFAFSAALAFINIFIRSIILQAVVYTVMLIAVLRVFSRNIPARSRENEAIMGIINRFNGRAETVRKRKADYTHIYKKCPHCRAVLRLPRKKGKHTTVCPRCGKSFTVRVFKDYKR